MRRYQLAVALSALAVASASAWGQPYFARGEFNGWGVTNPLTDMGGGHWQGTVTGLTSGNLYTFKLANESWSQNWPGSDGRIQANATGQATFHLYLNPAADGWSPSGPRVGYEDLGWDWDIMGSFNNWSSPITALGSMGNGLYTGEYAVASPGTYEFKFRKAGGWDISIGSDFGNLAGNIGVTTTLPNQVVKFELDLPNGRYRATAVPEPATLLLLTGGLCLIRRRR